jgi:hypothetical protein
MKRSVLLTLFLFFVLGPGLKAEVDFSVKEKSIIYTNAIKVLEDYQIVINQMGENVVSDIEKARSNAEGLLELFVNRQVLIYNDLDPAHKLSEFYEAETYTNNIILWYPDGITINLDLANARVSEIMSHEGNIYSIDILVKKTIDGNYLNQTLNQNVEDLTFRIAFSLENKSLSNFKIVGVRSAASNYVIDYSQALREVNAEEFDEEDMAKIQSAIKTLLQDYTNFLSLLGDPQELAEDKEFYKESFLNLFPESDTRVYNDISPDPETSLIAVTDYLTNYVTDYPNGIKNLSINVDSAKFGQVMKAEDGSYETYTDANKFFSGSFKGKDAFRNMFPLIFKISFTAAGKTFSDFRINSVDISAVDFYEAAAGEEADQLPQIIIRPVTRKGFGMSLIGSFGITSIDDKDIETLSLAQNSHSWSVSPLYGFISSIGVSYYFTDNIAVRSGLEFNKYSANFNLSGEFTDDVLSADANSITYYKIITADYDSLVNINYLTLPLLVNYTSGKPGKFGFFAESGIKISVPQKASYKTTGSYKFTGYYPDDIVTYKDWTELGFYDRGEIDASGTMKIKGFNIAFYGSAGINIPLGYYSSIKFGPEVIIGLTDILSDKKTYIDIFGKEYNHQPTKIKNFGLRVSLAYKL